MKVLVIGAGGIIGQHMMVTVPEWVDAVFTRREGSHCVHIPRDNVNFVSLLDLYLELNFTTPDTIYAKLDELNPDVIVNLAGEGSVDKVQADPALYHFVNVSLPLILSTWCDAHRKHLIHVSSQAALDPVSEYGGQKKAADELVQNGINWSIVRPTFTLGIRPFPGIGRENPAERMLAGNEHQSVDDRYFAVAFAWDVANAIWQLCTGPKERKIYYVGNPTRMSRYELAVLLATNKDVVPVKHDDLPGLAPRPFDTSAPYATGSFYSASLGTGLIRLRDEWNSRSMDGMGYRSKEIAAFLKLPWWDVENKVGRGFAHLHGEVAVDFRKSSPVTDQELLAWYRKTEAYIWELSAYHLHEGFNYAGMCAGIVGNLRTRGANRVLCLGDGTGDMSLAVARAGMSPIYHDLSLSRTAAFAESRFFMRGVKVDVCETDSFIPTWIEGVGVLDAVLSADFLEHVPNVEEWVRAIYSSLRPGGLFFAQNAFNCGSGPEGSIPMHLVINDHYEHDWNPLLDSIGFVQESNNWYRKPE